MIAPLILGSLWLLLLLCDCPLATGELLVVFFLHRSPLTSLLSVDVLNGLEYYYELAVSVSVRFVIEIDTISSLFAVDRFPQKLFQF